MSEVEDPLLTAAIALIVELSVADPACSDDEYGLTPDRMIRMAREFLKTWGLR
jgi:hypothetical protein